MEQTTDADRLNEVHVRGTTAIALSPDERTLAAASHDHTVKLWRLKSWQPAGGEPIHTLGAHSDSVWGVAFSHDGTTLASASVDGTVMLWNVAKGTHKVRFSDHASWVCWVAYAPDGKSIVSSSVDSTINVPMTGASNLSIPAHTSRAGFFDFSPDGRLLATASDDGTIGLWDVPAGTGRGRLLGHTQAVWDVAFSPDGRTLASTSDDKTIRLWDVNSGEQLIEHTIKTNARGTLAVAFSPDGKTLATTDWEGHIKLWDVQIPQSFAPSAEDIDAEPHRAGPRPALAVAPFDNAEAQKYQQAWAEYLDLPVALKSFLGMNLLLPAR